MRVIPIPRLKRYKKKKKKTRLFTYKIHSKGKSEQLIRAIFPRCVLNVKALILLNGERVLMVQRSYVMRVAFVMQKPWLHKSQILLALNSKCKTCMCVYCFLKIVCIFYMLNKSFFILFKQLKKR